MSSSNVTQLLVAYSEGDQAAFDKLVPLVYEHLRELARGRLRFERRGHTLNTTALVHEAFLKLIEIDRIEWQNRAHFFAVASIAMRRILVDYAKKRRAQKRGGGAEQVELDEERLMTDDQAETILDLDDALTRLEAEHPRQAAALQHRYFGGLTNEETSEALDVSVSTVERDVRFARSWIARAWDDGNARGLQPNV